MQEEAVRTPEPAAAGSRAKRGQNSQPRTSSAIGLCHRNSEFRNSTNLFRLARRRTGNWFVSPEFIPLQEEQAEEIIHERVDEAA